MKKFIYCPSLAAAPVEHHDFGPMVAGLSLQAVGVEKIAVFSRVRAAAHAKTEAEVQAALVAVVESATKAAADHRAALADRLAQAKKWLADAEKIAAAPLDPLGDSEMLATYIAAARQAEHAPIPDDSGAVRNAEFVARWYPRAEFDAAPIAAAVARHEAEGDKLAGIRAQIATVADKIEALMPRLDDPVSAARVKELQAARDIVRHLPDMIAAWARAQAQAEAAISAMADIMAEIKGVAHV